MKVTELNLPKNGKVDNYFIAGDWHTDALDLKSFDLLCKQAKLLPKRQRKLIINGDFIDCPHLMKRSPLYKTWKGRADGIEEFFIPISQKEFDWANDTLDALQSVFHKIWFIEGNHDWRYLEFAHSKDCPVAYRDFFNYRERLALDKRGIDYVAYNNWLDIGKLSITHGMYHGTTCKKKHYEAAGGRDVIFSHVHHYSSQAFSVRGQTRYARSLPAMCMLNPHYIKNRETNWDNGYGLITVYPNGNYNFNVYIKDPVYDSIILPNGKPLRA